MPTTVTGIKKLDFSPSIYYLAVHCAFTLIQFSNYRVNLCHADCAKKWTEIFRMRRVCKGTGSSVPPPPWCKVCQYFCTIWPVLKRGKSIHIEQDRCSQLLGLFLKLKALPTGSGTSNINNNKLSILFTSYCLSNITTSLAVFLLYLQHNDLLERTSGSFPCYWQIHLE